MRRFYILLVPVLLLIGCATPQKGHYGTFVFRGVVNSVDGNPVADAKVLVRGHESRTDLEGRWVQSHEIHCVGWSGGGDAFERENGLEISADGFDTYKMDFTEKYKGWAQSCGGKRNLEFKSTLKPKVGKAKV